MVKISGCAKTKIKHNYDFKFEINSFAWIKDKAKKGILEKIAIKKVLIRPYNVFLYKDTLNSLYNESDLITEQEAVDLARSYYEFIYSLERIC